MIKSPHNIAIRNGTNINRYTINVVFTFIKPRDISPDKCTHAKINVHTS